jgi:hypothetical protein
MKTGNETSRESMTKRIEETRDGLLADAWGTLRVGGTWAFELVAAAAGRALGGGNALLPSGVAAEQAAERAAPAAAGVLESSTEPGAAMTLRELGLPHDLASEFEAVFRLLGTGTGDVVAGYTFLAPDGVRHPVRLAPANGPDSPSEPGRDLAA